MRKYFCNFILVFAALTAFSQFKSPNRKGTIQPQIYEKAFAFSTDKADAQTGIAGEEKNPIEIQSGGSSIYIVLTNNNNELQTKKLYFDIYKKRGGDYNEYVETITETISVSDKTKIIKHNFYNAAEYKIMIFNEQEKWITTTYVSVKIKGNSSETFNYKNALIGFSTQAFGERDTLREKKYFFELDPIMGGMMFIYIENDNVSLNAEKIYAEVYKLEKENYLLMEKVVEKVEFSFRNRIFFRYPFAFGGDYKIVVYNESHRQICSGLINIRFK